MNSYITDITNDFWTIMDLLKPRMYNFFNTVTPRNVVTETPVLTTGTHKRTFPATLFITVKHHK